MKRRIFSLVMASALVLGIAAPAAAASSSPRSIVDVAIAVNSKTGLFDTLLTAATCSQFNGAVVDYLNGPEQRTLFAPTDAAFAKLGLNPSNVCSALPADALLDILLYHVIDAKVGYLTAVRLIGQEATMANGDTAAITGTWWNLKIDGARVILPNVRAGNGYIHVVNAVLLPPA